MIRIVLWSCLVSLTGLGCRGGEREPVRAATDGSALSGEGLQGLFYFELELQPDPPRTGELFRVVTAIRDVKTGQPLEQARFELDATMPHHAHGMTTRPEHEALGGGRYLSRGMKLHMPGQWHFTARAEKDGRRDEVELIHQQPHGAAR
jgi:hypothetical protein